MKNNNIAAAFNRNRNTISIILILVVGFILRFAGINWGLPDWMLPASFHPNEANYVRAAIDVSNGAFSNLFWSKPSNFWILILGALFFIPTKLGLFNDITSYYILARLFTVALSVLTIWLTYKTSRQLFGDKKIVLLPPLIVSIMMLHIYESHIAWMNIPATFMGALSLFYTSRIFSMSESENYNRMSLILNLLLSSVALGIGASLKYQLGFTVFPLIASICFLRFKPEIKIRMLFTAGVITVITFLLTNPYWLLNFRDGLSSITGTYHHYSTGHGGIIPTVGLTFVDTYGNIFTLLKWWIGIPFAVLFILGLINSLARHKRLDIFILSFLVPFYLFFGYFILTFGRHLLPSLVLISILITKLIYDSELFINSSGKRYLQGKVITVARNVLISGVVLCLVYSLLYSLAFVNIFSDVEGDTRVQATNWVNENIPESSSVGIDPGVSKWMRPRLDKEKHQIVKDYSESDYTIIISTQYVKMYHYLTHKELYKEEDWYPYQPPSEKNQQFYLKLFNETSSELIAEFRGEPHIFGLQFNTAEAPYHVWAVTHPTIRIYHLRK